MKRLIAGLMVILMLGQYLPGVSFAASMEELPAKEVLAEEFPAEEDRAETVPAEEWHEAVSDPVEKPVYHTVTFTADGETVTTIFVADGAVISELPVAPVISGKDFLGWYDGERPFTVESAVYGDLEVQGFYGESADLKAPEAEMEGALYANEDLYITGKIPGNGIIEVTPVRSGIKGEELICAYDISIYANKKQWEKGKTWQPADRKIQVHLRNKAFGNDKLNIYHMGENGAEYINTVVAKDGWIEFEASSFSVYVFTRSIEKTVTISGKTYRITVAYDAGAGIPDDAELEVREVAGGEYLAEASAVLGWTGEDEVVYAKFLDISIVSNGKEVVPSGDVKVTVELLDVKEGAEALEVVHFAENGSAEKIAGEAAADGTVTFTTGSFSVFGFGSVLRSLATWSSDALTCTLQGFSRLLNPSYTAVSVAVEEGLEVLDAYNVRTGLSGLLNALYVRISTAVNLNSRESLIVYSLKNGALSAVLEESASNVNDSISLGAADGFAVVRDTGYRRKTFALGDVELSGMIPKAAGAEAESVTVDEIEGEVLAAYDIHISENGAEYQPDEAHPVEVAIHVGQTEKEALCLWHIRDDGTREEITDFTYEDGKIRFIAHGFSVYVAANVKLRTYRFYTLNETGDYIDYVFSTDQGETTFTQTIKNGESLIVPSNPTNPYDPDSSFAGWYECIISEDGTGRVLAEDPYDFNHIPKITKPDEEVGLYAKFSSFAYVIFHDQYDEKSGIFPIAFTRRVALTNGHGQIRIDAYDVSCNDSVMAFFGWSKTSIRVPGADRDDENQEIVKLADELEVEKSIHLYPIFKPIFWLSYNSGPTGSGATYIQSASLYDGIGPAVLQVPERSGYTFAGWYTGRQSEGTVTYGTRVSDADGNLIEGVNDTTYGVAVIEGTLVLSKDATLYAMWNDSAVDYTVVVWRQKSTDAAGLADADKSYDFLESFKVASTTDTSVSLGDTPEYMQLTERTTYDACHPGHTLAKESDNPYYGCEYNSSKSDTGEKTVRGDGSTILNVYYDRIAYTVKFYYARSRINNQSIRYQVSTTMNIGTLQWSGDSSTPVVCSAPSDSLLSEQRDNYTYYYYNLTANYGASIEEQWPQYSWFEEWQTGGGNYNLVSWALMEHAGAYGGSGSGQDTVKGIISIMDSQILGDMGDPENNYLYASYSTQTSYEWRNNIYFPVISGESYAGTMEYGGSLYYLARTFTSRTRTSGTNPGAQHEPTYEGYTYIGETSSDRVVNFFYSRNSHKLHLLDSLSPESYVSVSGVQQTETEIGYGEDLSGYIGDPDPAEGRSFNGWYTSSACTMRVFFSAEDETYQDYKSKGRSCILYETMPDSDLPLYAGWESIWYLIQIDPNYGVLTETESTWFWIEYGSGETIKEYLDVTRNYVESDAGTYYYVNQNRAHYGYPDTYVSGESGNRKTFYTMNPEEASEFTTYEESPKAYRYDGWYEVDKATGEESETPYVFEQEITHDVYLKLHWKKLGCFYIAYDPGIGSLGNEEADEQLYVELDGSSYADNAEVLITRKAEAPEHYEFTGWRIRGDVGETIYYPGDVFTLLKKYAVTVQGKQWVYLDAVYTAIPTASIIYHANGGTVTEEGLDYGHLPSGTSAPTPVTSCNVADGTATISNLVNNSRIILSSGAGFSMPDVPGATFAGWSNKAVYDPADTEAILFKPADETEKYNVDINEPLDLYAVWQVSVNFHLNHSTSDSNFGGTWDAETYTLSQDGTVYIRDIFLNNVQEVPEKVPVYTGSEVLIFRNWRTAAHEDNAASDDSDIYDFSQPVTGSLDLYAYWASPALVLIHAVDASAEVLEEETDWRKLEALSVGTAEISLNAETAVSCVEPPSESEYEFAFAAVHKSGTDLNTITEDDTVQSVWYDASEGGVCVRKDENTTAVLAADEEIYFIYYEKKALPIGYRSMSVSGRLNELTVTDDPPTETGSLGAFVMDTTLTAPLSYPVSGSDYTHYAYAIGPGAIADNASSSILRLITDSSSSDTNRPLLQVRNTWRGFEASTDGGTTWTAVGYQSGTGTIGLYVVYYASQPELVTLSEKTIGLMEDQSVGFEYIVTVTQTTDGIEESISEDRFTLTDGESRTIPLHASQTVTITQVRAKAEGSEEDISEAFTTSVADAVSVGQDQKTWTYTTNGTSNKPVVTFTNTRTSIPVEVHVALVHVTDGTITLRDDWRTSAQEKYSFDLDINTGDQHFATKLPASDLFSGDAANYAFGTVFYGTCDHTDITLKGMNVDSIAYEPVAEGEERIYSVRLKDSDGAVISDLDSNQIYYLYYPMPRIMYVEETEGGVLTPIRGSTDGSVACDSPTYSQAALTMNGVTVEQNQRLEVPVDGLKIAQAANSFRMPPLLDRWDDDTSTLNQLYLIYNKIGAGNPEADSTDDILTSEDLTLYLGISDNKIQYSFDHTTWYPFLQDKWPTIYAIYRERGYNLEITKTVPVDTGFAEPFTVTVSSAAINRSSYKVEGLGVSTIDATPASGSTPGTLTFTVSDGSDVKLLGMSTGEYTITESGHENFSLSAQIRRGSAEAVPAEIAENNAFTVNVDSETVVDLTNTSVYICQVGTNKFYTLTSAVNWIRDYSNDFSGTIEMLVDYVQPETDAPEIPNYMDVTLTTASSYSGKATITRRSTFTSGAMLTNCGTLTLENITLDGNHVAASGAILDNEGTLTVGGGADLRNGNNRTGGGAVNSWAGTVSVVDGAMLSGNSAAQGGAIYVTGGTIDLAGGMISDNTARDGGAVYYSGSETVRLTGGTITGNSAANGGAVYVNTGALDMSGGKLRNNHASGKGGAVYAANAALTFSGGTVGGEDAGNTSNGDGGAVCLEAGSVTVTGSAAISHNTSTTGNGGAVCSDIGSVSVEGGNVEHNTASGGSGGAVYTNSGAVAVSGGNISNNEANTSGGAVYTESGITTLTGTNTIISGNTAANGNGGGVYAGSGTVTVNAASLTGNKALSGVGGALWTGTGQAVVTNNASFTSNEAQNGAAIFTSAGSVTFSGGSVQSNTATEGGAVGVGSPAAKLYFAGNVKVTGNTMISGTVSVPSNVYLDQDSDAVINASGIGGSAEIGVYVPDVDVQVDGETENLFDRHGVPGAFFATYTSTNNVDKFKNDRLPGLSVQQETTSKRLFWGKAFEVEVRYLASYVDGLPPAVAGTSKYTDSNYFAPSGYNAVSALADDLYDKVGSSSAVFGHAFLSGVTSFNEYITDVNWDSGNNRWSFIKRDGTEAEYNTETTPRLILYYAEPAYISVENNTSYPLVMNSLSVTLGSTQMPVINTPEQAGYGYVFAKNGSLQDELRPVTAEDLTLDPGKSIRIVLPGGRNADYSLSGVFTGAEGVINYTRTTEGAGELPEEQVSSGFTLTGKTLNNSSLYEIIFGGSGAICRIVTEPVENLAAGEISGQTNTANAAGKIEYTFATLNQALAFIKTHNLSQAKIEMLVDYLIPGTDVVNLPAGYDIGFGTATEGTFVYSTNPEARATISRAQRNDASFISVPDGKNTAILRVDHLIFDGKSFSGSIDGGVIKTNACKEVYVDYVDFNNCVANNGGGMYIQTRTGKSYGDPGGNGKLEVTNSNFRNCVSNSTAERQGGGAIWMDGKKMILTNCTFASCSAVDQGGAVFHRIDGDHDSSTSVTSCSFTGCSANAAGSMETDAKTVTVTGCTFKDSIAKKRNGGGFNVYALNSATPTSDCSVTVTNSTFENCFALQQNGGALRSSAQNTTVSGCTFRNTTGKDGGAISISSDKAQKGTIQNCSIDGGVAANQGGGIFCAAKEFVIEGDHNSIKNCTAQNGGGAVYFKKGTSFTVSDCLIDNCVSLANDGGGIYTNTQELTLNQVSVKNCTSKRGGGIYAINPVTFTANSLTVADCTATGNGGGIYYEYASGTMLLNGSEIAGNTSSGQGGGIFTNAYLVTLIDSSLENNTASGSGGGIYQNSNNTSGRLTVDASTISGNTSGGQGGGTYTKTYMTIRNDSMITGNRLSTATVGNAAGVYMVDKTLTVGKEGATGKDHSSIKENYAVDGSPSDLRLWMNGTKNHASSVYVNCRLDGEIRVVNAAVKGSQFGLSAIAYPYGFSDLFHVFIADDNSLYGIIDRQDDAGKKIIWAGDPICKITDERGRLLYLDTEHSAPAVFDILDDGKKTRTSAFGLLRNTEPELYNADGTPYTGPAYQVKMLVENYTATKAITTTTGSPEVNVGRTITFTTAGSKDSLYPYRGRKGTRSTITANVGNYPLLTSNINLNLTNIILDGGSESGVASNSKTRILYVNEKGTTVTLGKNAALQNGKVVGNNNNGGGVYVNNGSLVLEGGTIRNCASEWRGGGINITGTGSLLMSGGTITKCSAERSGGGVCLENGTFTMTGGSITRSTAQYGGGVFIENNREMNMTGGSITANNASNRGGGITVNGSGSRLYFSGAAYVYGNTSDASVAQNKACNVEMNQAFSVQSDNPATMIVSKGLIRGAAIGVYVPNQSSLYTNHGEEGDPFGTYAGGTSKTNFHYFINDRNGLKGGLMANQAEENYKIYWHQIYSLEVTKLVLSDDPADLTKSFYFEITMSYENGDPASDLTGTYGDMVFSGGKTRFTLTNGETKAATNLDPGYYFRVEEILTDSEKAYYNTTPGLIQTGHMNDPSQYVYAVTFSNIHAVCKITDTNYGLLYYEKENGTFAPAVYSSLTTAFNHLKTRDLYYREGDLYERCRTVNSQNTKVEMLVENYALTEQATFHNGTKAILTTAEPNATDGFPYVGTGTAKIIRGATGPSLINVQGDLTLQNIILDGDSGNYSANTDGGLFRVAAGGILTVNNGAVLQNSGTTASGGAIYNTGTVNLTGGSIAGNKAENGSGGAVYNGGTVNMSGTAGITGNQAKTGGAVYNAGTMNLSGGTISGNTATTAAGIYLAEGITMNISGKPAFSNNTVPFTDTAAKNGGDSVYASGKAEQDIYIDGYSNRNAASLNVTGKLTGQAGSIWIWADDAPHYRQQQQFATLSGNYTGLNVFRNARTDTDTGNTTGTWLYGVTHDGDTKNVYWCGLTLTITKTLTGDMADLTETFAFTVTGLTAGKQYHYQRYTSEDGTTWVPETEGAGYMTSDADGKLTGDPLQLGHHRKIEITLLNDVTVTVSEESGSYRPSYVLDGGSAVNANSTTDIQMRSDHVVAFTNDMPAVAPTDYRVNLVPYLLMLLCGFMLLLHPGRKKRAGSVPCGNTGDKQFCPPGEKKGGV